VQDAMDTGQLEVRRGKTLRFAGAGLTRRPGSSRSNKCSSPGRRQGTPDKIPGAHGMGAGQLTGVEDLIEFETRVNYVVPKYDDIVICAYDLSKFGASVVMAPCGRIPVVIVGGLLQENPFFRSTGPVPPRDKGATAGSQERRHGELNADRSRFEIPVRMSTMHVR